ncbi:uncharacterized protein LOC131063097 [Cryptomeria japonica]|uniref:uncharacterized protein LOC131063097 n=1 Tax=Cryptomeria japonica TaxID=3369 RepID=UPI0027DA3C70|nr:uncharacterized protein LOC131063097 [Cryptomeria japonica]
MASHSNILPNQHKCRLCPALFLTRLALEGHNNAHRSEKVQEEFDFVANLFAKRLASISPPVHEKRLKTEFRGSGFPSTDALGLPLTPEQVKFLEENCPEVMLRFPPTASPDNLQNYSSSPSLQSVFEDGEEQVQKMGQNFQCTQDVLTSQQLLNSSSSSNPQSVGGRGAEQFEQMDQNVFRTCSQQFQQGEDESQLQDSELHAIWEYLNPH